QQFWLDPVEGVRAILPFMLAAVIYRHEASKEANDIGTFFAETIGLPYRNWWTWASQGLVRATNRGFLPPEKLPPEKLHGLEELEELLRQRHSIFPPSLST